MIGWNNLRWKLLASPVPEEAEGIRNFLLLWVTNLVYHDNSYKQNWNFDYCLCERTDGNIRFLVYLFFFVDVRLWNLFLCKYSMVMKGAGLLTFVLIFVLYTEVIFFLWSFFSGYFFTLHLNNTFSCL